MTTLTRLLSVCAALTCGHIGVAAADDAGPCQELAVEIAEQLLEHEEIDGTPASRDVRRRSETESSSIGWQVSYAFNDPEVEDDEYGVIYQLRFTAFDDFCSLDAVTVMRAG